MALEFLVRNQRLKLFSGGPVVADSQQYLKARFTFSDDWQGTRKYAQFRRDGEVYTCNIDEYGEVEVPWETLVGKGVVQISAFATNQQDETNKLITTNPVFVKVETSGIKETELPKTPSLGILGDSVDESLKEITDARDRYVLQMTEIRDAVLEAKDHIDQTDYKIYVGETAPTEDITNAMVWINPAEDDNGSDELAEAVTAAQNAATSVKKYKALWFDSVAAMKAEPSLTAGAYVCTAGYYAPNDGGGASYLIRAKNDADVDDGGSIHELANGLVAEFIRTEKCDNLYTLNNLSELSEIAKLNYGKLAGCDISQSATIIGLENLEINFDVAYPFQWKNYNQSTDTGNHVLTFRECKNIIIRGLRLLSDIDNDNIGLWSGVRFTNCENVIFENGHIEGFRWCGLVIDDNCNNITIKQSLFKKCKFKIHDLGINTIITQNTITDDFEGTWTSDSLYYDGINVVGTGTIVSNNHIYKCGQSGIYSSKTSNVSIIGNIIESNYNGGVDLGLLNAELYKISNITISGNVIKSNQSMEINLSGVENCIVSGNTINKTIGFNSVAIVLDGTSKDVLVCNNSVDNTMVDGYGFSIGKDCISCCLLDNKLSCDNEVAGSNFFISNDKNNTYRDIKDNMKKMSTITFSVGTDDNYSQVYKTLNQVTITLYCKILSEIGGYGVLATLSDGFYPDGNDVMANGVICDYNNNIYPVLINSNGEVVTQKIIPANTSIRGTIVFDKRRSTI